MSKNVLVIVVFLALLPLASADTYPFVKFTLIGDSPGVYELVDVGSWGNPTYMSVHTGPGDNCAGGGCWSRYMENKVFDLNLVSFDGNLLANMTLDGWVFATTAQDQETFTGTSFLWGYANIVKVDPDFNVEGDFVVAAEAWGHNIGKFALIDASTGTQGYTVLTQFDLNMENIMDGEVIVDYNIVSVDEIEKDKQYTIDVNGWGPIDYNAEYEVLKYQMKNQYSHIYDRSTILGSMRTSTITTYWVYSGWGKGWYDSNTGKYHRIFWGYELEEGSTGITDTDGDGYYSNEDCNDLNAGINPGALEVPGNSVDEDCSGADMKITGTITTSFYDLYHATIDLYVDGSPYSSVLTGESGAGYGDYEIYSNDPGTGYLEFMKPGFITKQSPSFSMDIGYTVQDDTLQQNNTLAGSVTGTIQDMSLNPLNNVELFVEDSTGIIQKLVSGNGTYIVIGLPSSQITGETYIITSPGCIVYGGEDIPIMADTTSNRDLYLDCGG